MRCFGLGGGIEPGGGGNGVLLLAGERGAAFVGERGDVWTLGVIGGSFDD